MKAEPWFSALQPELEKLGVKTDGAVFEIQVSGAKGFEKLVGALRMLAQHPQAQFSVLEGITYNEQAESGSHWTYLLRNPDRWTRLSVRAGGAGRPWKSVSEIFPSASALEAEVTQVFGVEFSGSEKTHEARELFT